MEEAFIQLLLSDSGLSALVSNRIHPGSLPQGATLVELQRCHETAAPPLSKLCMAYGAVLRYAGAPVKDEEVYAGLFGTDAAQSTIMESLTVILAMMIPPDAIRSKTEGKPVGKSRAAATPASKKRSKRRSSASG